MILETKQNWFHNFLSTTQTILNLQFALEAKLENILEKERGRCQVIRPGDPMAQCGAQPSVAL